jgi:hypothetical protein
LTESSAIHRGNVSNRVELRCADDLINARINGEELASVQDGTYRTGTMWIGVSGAGVEAYFDNLIVDLR